jgi:hypothetical protein
MTPITAPRPGSRQRAVAVLMTVALVLLSVSCAKKAAMQVASTRQAAVSTFNETRVHGGARSASATAMLSGSQEDQPPSSVSVALADAGQPDTLDARKIIRNGSLDLLVNDLGQSVDKIGSIVKGASGFVEKATQMNGSVHSATVTVRIPAGRLDQVMAQIKALATNVDRESVEVRDVTREYIDLDARLRNAQAEEAQYLQILKRATTIKDTLDVTEKLTDLRGQIEQLQGEMKFLTSQIDMSTLEITLRAEADESVAGFHWRPLRQARIAVNDMVSGLADWVDSVVAFFINLPLIAAWLLSILALVVIAIRLVRYLWRRFGPKTSWRLPWKRPAAPVSTPGPG